MYFSVFVVIHGQKRFKSESETDPELWVAYQPILWTQKKRQHSIAAYYSAIRHAPVTEAHIEGPTFSFYRS
jgi:hypothetical protein